MIRTSRILFFGFLAIVSIGFSPRLAGADEAEKGKGSKSLVVALIGDSTVTDTSGWGRAFADSFDSSVRIVNFAAGGRSSKSFFDENRFDPVLELKPEYLFIQFGHNGQPGKGPKRETDPETTYRDWLRLYIREAKRLGTKPIVVSSVTRRDFTQDGKIRTERVPGYKPAAGEKVTLPLKPWAEAARAVADEEGVPFIDLYALSVAYHNRIGPDKSATFNPKEGDITHFNEEGAKAIAGLILGELPDAAPELAKRVIQK